MFHTAVCAHLDSAALSSNRLSWAHCLLGENNPYAFVTHFGSDHTKFYPFFPHVIYKTAMRAFEMF